jgi:protein phosphatase
MSSLSMCCAILSDAGRRANNEDAVFASPRLAAVADGVGGAAAGEVASRWALNEMIALEKRRLMGELANELRQAVQNANQTLGFLIACHPQWSGMGTTLTAVALSNDGEYLIANVGDSRAYLYRDGELSQLTRDQSLVQMLIDRGVISSSQAREHPQRSIVLEVLDGTRRTIAPPVRLRAYVGDRLLLCSDGVSDVLVEEQITDALKERSREAAAAQLVSLALGAGGKDNISAIIADIVPRDDPAAGWLDALPPPGQRSRRP